MTSIVRYDDQLTTLMAVGSADGAARSACWSQLVDVLARNRSNGSSSLRDAAIVRLIEWRQHVSVERRLWVASSIAQPSLAPDIVAYFGSDAPQIAAPVLMRAVISDDAWLSIIPTLPPASRALLRERRDLGPLIVILLASFGSSDFALPAVAAARAASIAPQVTQIRDLVARIEAFQKDRAAILAVVPQPPAPPHFRFETDDEAVICWVDGIARGRLIGISLATMAVPGGAGVDGHAAGAVRGRSEFHGARLAIAGSGDIAGIWLISGMPLFDVATGRFTGYRGIGNRSAPGQPVPLQNPRSFAQTSGLTSDSVRQLVHELRTPLNAIRGFAEMISSQSLGPVSESYRQLAGSIVDDSAKVAAIIDDLDTAARLDTDAGPAFVDDRDDCEISIAEVAATIRRIGADRGISVDLFVPPAPHDSFIGQRAGERLIERLIMVAVGTAAPGETIRAKLIEDVASVRVSIARSQASLAFSAAALLDPATELAGEWPNGPPLGLGFSLRLIANLALAMGAKFSIDQQNFTLILPSARDTEHVSNESV